MRAISPLTNRYRMRNKRRLGRVLPKVAKVANDIYWSGSNYPGVLSYHTPLVKMTPYFHIMCFGLSAHALMDSNIASRLSVLMGPICMVNIRESCWLQWQSTLTTRYSLSPLLLWIMSRGPIGGVFTMPLRYDWWYDTWRRHLHNFWPTSRYQKHHCKLA